MRGTMIWKLDGGRAIMRVTELDDFYAVRARLTKGRATNHCRPLVAAIFVFGAPVDEREGILSFQGLIHDVKDMRNNVLKMIRRIKGTSFNTGI